MDSGTVVWLPGGGYSQSDWDAVCQDAYGSSYYGCGSDTWHGDTLVYCCPY